MNIIQNAMEAFTARGTHTPTQPTLPTVTAAPSRAPHLTAWTPADVAGFLESHGIASAAFLADNVGGELLWELSEQELQEKPYFVSAVRARMLRRLLQQL